MTVTKESIVAFWQGVSAARLNDYAGVVARNADLTDADLTDADLTNADLTNADLTNADLTNADLTDADLRTIKRDFWALLAHVVSEVPALRKALIDGRVNGSVYKAECACLVGTIANVRGCNYQNIPGLIPDAGRPAERFTLAIKEGDTPETNAISKLLVEWIDAFAPATE